MSQGSLNAFAGGHTDLSLLTSQQEVIEIHIRVWQLFRIVSEQVKEWKCLAFVKVRTETEQQPAGVRQAPSPSCPLAPPVPAPLWQRHLGVDARCPLGLGCHSRLVGRQGFTQEVTWLGQSVLIACLPCPIRELSQAGKGWEISFEL